MKKLIRAGLRKFGFDLIRHQEIDPISDLSADEKKMVSLVKPFTMTSIERIAAVVHAVKHISDKCIPGDIAECGVWRGGSMMAIALALIARGDTSRELYLYDTFDGMSAPTDDDKCWDGRPATTFLNKEERGTGSWSNGIWCYASLDDVRANVLSTGYPADKIHFIKGKVEETIPATLPSRLALLRLDTDWYASTKHELDHLFPLLNKNGIMIVDDYGAWQGARKAVDEYFTGHIPFLFRIDNTGRMLVKS